MAARSGVTTGFLIFRMCRAGLAADTAATEKLQTGRLPSASHPPLVIGEREDAVAAAHRRRPGEVSVIRRQDGSINFQE
jgi:hypothetical protein